MSIQKFWIVRNDRYEQRLPVDVSFENDYVVISQFRKEIIITNAVIIKDATFNADGTITGLISSRGELQELADAYGLGDDDTFDYTCVRYTAHGWLDECNTPIIKSNFADINANETDIVLATFTTQILK